MRQIFKGLILVDCFPEVAKSLSSPKPASSKRPKSMLTNNLSDVAIEDVQRLSVLSAITSMSAYRYGKSAGDPLDPAPALGAVEEFLEAADLAVARRGLEARLATAFPRCASRTQSASRAARERHTRASPRLAQRERGEAERTARKCKWNFNTSIIGLHCHSLLGGIMAKPTYNAYCVR